jgi:SAM-dependent methyltransferase
VSRGVNDADFVRDQYANEEHLRARKSVYAQAEGDDARAFALEAIAAARPRRVLEVGGGEGELAELIATQLDAEVVGVDQSERMVELQRSRGIDARVGDAQQLPFADGEFDVVVAAWMLYHVENLDATLDELARVLKPGGVLVAVTNALDHLVELSNLAGRNPLEAFSFRSDNGAEVLRRHFAEVESRDARGWVTMDDATVRSFAASWEALAPILALPPLEQPLRARRHNTVFVARKAVS